MNDLATLLREDISATEPMHGLDALVPVRLGRRRLRTRRLISAAAAALVVAVGAAVVVPLVSGDDAAGPSRGVDPASQNALDEYNAQRMPQLMDEHVRGVLTRSVPDLGPVTFRATDGQLDELSPDLYDKASGMSVQYGPLEHRFRTSILHSGSEAEGSADQYCRNGLSSGLELQCTVGRTADGDVVITSLKAMRPMGNPENEKLGFMTVRKSELSTVDPGILWFGRTVKVIKSETLITYVDEQVQAPTLAAAEAVFRAPVEDLVEIGTDPVLVMPAPPTDDSGCGPWTLDPNVTYC